MIEAVAIGDDPSDENERTMSKVIIHTYIRTSPSDTKNFHGILWYSLILSEERDTVLMLRTYYIRGAKAERQDRTTKDCTVPARRGSPQYTDRPRKEILASHVKSFLQKTQQ